jgi:1-acyl-sn-glycerol-3-phosphate acyltransferase
MFRTLRSIWAWTAIITLILVWVPIMAVTLLFDRDPARYRTGRMFRRLGYTMIAANPAWNVEITGNLPQNPRLPYVVVANHQSHADIPVISRLPWDMKWMAKAELFKLPALGWMMRVSRDLPVDRKNRSSRAEVMVHARERLDNNVSIMVFPEGTRTSDGRVRRFSDGAFRLAIATGHPILPIAVEGSFDALPRDGWKFGPPLTVNVHVFDPVPVDGLTANDARDLCHRVRHQIIEKVAEVRGVPVSEIDGQKAAAEPAAPVADRASA